MYGLQLLRHGRGNPDTDQCWTLRIDTDQGVRQAAQHWEQACPPYAYGESYRAEYSALGKASHTGKVSTEARRPDRTRIPDMADRTQMSHPPCGLSQPEGAGNGHLLHGSAGNRGTGCGKTARPGLYGGRRVTGVPTVAAPEERMGRR